MATNKRKLNRMAQVAENVRRQMQTPQQPAAQQGALGTAKQQVLNTISQRSVYPTRQPAATPATVTGTGAAASALSSKANKAGGATQPAGFDMETYKRIVNNMLGNAASGYTREQEALMASTPAAHVQPLPKAAPEMYAQQAAWEAGGGVKPPMGYDEYVRKLVAAQGGNAAYNMGIYDARVAGGQAPYTQAEIDAISDPNRPIDFAEGEEPSAWDVWWNVGGARDAIDEAAVMQVNDMQYLMASGAFDNPNSLVNGNMPYVSTEYLNMMLEAIPGMMEEQAAEHQGMIDRGVLDYVEGMRITGNPALQDYIDNYYDPNSQTPVEDFVDEFGEASAIGYMGTLIELDNKLYGTTMTVEDFAAMTPEQQTETFARLVNNYSTYIMSDEGAWPLMQEYPYEALAENIEAELTSRDVLAGYMDEVVANPDAMYFMEPNMNRVAHLSNADIGTPYYGVYYRNDEETYWQGAPLSMMSEMEAAVFFYIANTEGTDQGRAREYLDALAPVLEVRQRNADKLAWGYASTADWVGAVGSWVAARGANLLNPAAALVEMGVEMVTGEESAVPNALHDFTQTVTSSQQAALGAMGGPTFLGQNWQQWAYGAGTNMVDMGLAIAVGGKVAPMLGMTPNAAALMLMSGEAAASQWGELAGQDMATWEKVARTIGSGAIEALTEKLPLDAITGKFGTGWLRVLMSAGSEAVEEMVSELSGYGLDAVLSWIAGHPNEVQTRMSELEQMGVQNPEEVVLGEIVTGTLQAGVGGTLAGFAMGGTADATDFVRDYNLGSTIRTNNTSGVNALVDFAGTMAEGTESRRLAETLKGKAEGGKVSSRKVGELFRTLIAETPGRYRAEIEEMSVPAVVEALEDTYESLGMKMEDRYSPEEIARAILSAEGDANALKKTAIGKFIITHRGTKQVAEEFAKANAEWSQQLQERRTAKDLESVAAMANIMNVMNKPDAEQMDAAPTAESVKETIQDKDVEAITGRMTPHAGLPRAVVMTAEDGSSTQSNLVRVERSGDGLSLVVSQEGQEGETTVTLGEGVNVPDSGIAQVLAYAQQRRWISAGEINDMMNLALETQLPAASVIAAYEAGVNAGFIGADMPKAETIAAKLGKAQADKVAEVISMGMAVGASTAQDAEAVRKAAAEKRSAMMQRGSGSVTYMGKVTSMAEAKGSKVRQKVKGIRGRLTAEQNAAVDALGQMSRVLGVNIVLYESTGEAGQTNTMANGWYDQATRDIYIDLNSGMTTFGQEAVKFTILKTAAHELTHYIESSSANGYAQLRQAVREQLEERGEDYGALIIDKAKNSQTLLNRVAAEAEVIADACEMMLTNSRAITELANRNKGLAAKVAQFINRFRARVARAMAGLTATSREAVQLVNAGMQYVNGLQQTWDRALIEAANADAAKVRVSSSTRVGAMTGEGGIREAAQPATDTEAAADAAEETAADVAADEEAETMEETPGKIAPTTGTAKVVPVAVDVEAISTEVEALTQELDGDELGIAASALTQVASRLHALNEAQLEGVVTDAVSAAADVFQATEPTEAVRAAVLNHIRSIQANARAAMTQDMRTTMAEKKPAMVEAVASEAAAEALQTVETSGVTEIPEEAVGPIVADMAEAAVEAGIQAAEAAAEAAETAELLQEGAQDTEQSLLPAMTEAAQNVAAEAYVGTNEETRAVLVQVAEGVARAAEERVSWEAAVSEARGRVATEQPSDAGTPEMKGYGIVEDAATGTAYMQMSERTWRGSDYVKKRNEMAQRLAEKTGVTPEKAGKWIDDVTGIADMIANNRSILDYIPSRFSSPFKTNPEYGGTIDMSTLCPKRALATATLDAIQRIIGDKAMTREDFVRIRKMMQDKGYEVACGLCFVESSRANMSKYVEEFIAEYRRKNPGAEVAMPMLNTVEGLEATRENNYPLYEAFETFMNKLAQRKPKLFEKRSEYTDEILRAFMNDTRVADKNLMGGLRIQSFSDFEVIHLIDMMQVITDMSTVGLAGQAYTKQPNFARALGNTNLKINLSLIAKDVTKDGQLIFDPVEGMDPNVAFELREQYSKNVGTVVVVFTDSQLKAAMAHPQVDFIIPFHRSQWKKSDYAMLGLPARTKDYTLHQNERHRWQDEKGKWHTTKVEEGNYLPNDYWRFDLSGKENAQIYLDMCNSEGRIPKFPFLLDKKGGKYQLKEDGSTDGYWKLLIDFKMYDNAGVGSEQLPVVPNFNMDECYEMLRKYKGGHDNVRPAQDVVDEFVADFLRRDTGLQSGFRGLDVEMPGVQFSERRQTETDAFRRWFGDSKVVNPDGSPKVVYHQTAAAFTVFNTDNPVAGLNDSETPNGMFFKDNDHDIGLGGAVQMAVYLRMERPLHFRNREEANAWYRRNVPGYDAVHKQYDDAMAAFEPEFKAIEDEQFEPNTTDERVEELFEIEEKLIQRMGEVETGYRARLRELLNQHFLTGNSGYDGIELDYDGHRWVNGVRENVHTYIVFSPRQIKSATDNVGTFDPENPDIRYSERRATAPSLRETLLAMEPTSDMTATEKELLAKYKTLVADYRELESQVEAQRTLAETAEREYETLQTTPARDEYLAQNNRLGVLQSKLRRASDALYHAEKRGGFGNLMNRYRLMVRTFYSGKNQTEAAEKLRQRLSDIEHMLREIESDKDYMEVYEQVGKAKNEAWMVGAKAKRAAEEVAKYHERLERHARLMAERENLQQMNDLLKSTVKSWFAERELMEERRKLMDGIRRQVHWMDIRIRRETDQRRIPEGLKPVVEEAVRIFGAANSQLKVFTAKELDGILRTYEKLKEVHGTDLHRMDDIVQDNLEDALANLRAMTETFAKTAEVEDRMERIRQRVTVMQEISDVISMIRNAIEKADVVVIEGQERSLQDVTQRLSEDLGSRQDYSINARVGKVWEQVKEHARNGNLTPPMFFRLIGSSVLTELNDSLMSAQGKHARLFNAAKARLAEIKKANNYYAWQNNAELEMTTWQGGDKHQIQLTPEEALSIWVTWKREHSDSDLLVHSQHLEEGGFNLARKERKVGKRIVYDGTPHKLSQKDFETIDAWLTDEMKAYAEDIVQYLSTDMAELGNEVSMQLFGIRKFTESYYFPMKVKPEQLEVSSSKGAKDPGESNRVAHFGGTKRRVDQAKKALVIGGITEVAAQHINEMLLYNTFAIPIESFNKVLNQTYFEGEPLTEEERKEGNEPDPASRMTMRGLFKQKMGDDLAKYLQTYIADLNGGLSQDGRDKGMADRFLSLYKRSAVMASLSVAIQQPSAIVRAMYMVDWKYFVPLLQNKDSVNINITKEWAQLTKYSNTALVKERGGFDMTSGRGLTEQLMGNEGDDFDFMQRQLAKVGVGFQGGAKQKAKGAAKAWENAAGFLPGFMDQVTWTMMWRVVKAEVADKNRSLDKNSEEFLQLAAKRFDEVMNLTQVYDSTLVRSHNMRSKSMGMKMLTAFMGESTVTANMLLDSWATKKPKMMARAAVVFFAQAVFNAALKALWTAFRDDDEEKAWVEKYLGTIGNQLGGYSGALNPAALIPGLKDMMALADGYDVERADMAVWSDLITEYKRYTSGYYDNRPAADMVQNIGGAVANLFGIPLKNVMRDVRTGVNALEQIFGSNRETTWLGLAHDASYNFVLVRDRDNAYYYNRLYEGLASGNKQDVEDVREFLGVLGKKPDTIDTGIRSVVKDKFLAGELTKEEAMAYLVTHGLADDEKEAYKYVDKWREAPDHEGEEDYSYSQYNTMYEAIDAGDMPGINAAVKELKEHGFLEDKGTLKSTLRGKYRDLYRSLNKTNKTQFANLQAALVAALVAAGVPRSEALEYVKGWLKDTEKDKETGK